MTIAELWKFFVENERHLRLNALSSKSIRRLQEHLDAVLPTRVDWEIGPHGDGQQFFALSPAWQPDDVRDAARIVIGAAPHVDGWVFRLFKPPRDWDLTFAYGDVQIDGTRWEVILAGTGTERIARFRPDAALARVSEDLLRQAALTLLDGELGAELRDRYIEKVELVRAWTPDDLPHVQRIERGLLPRLVAS